MHQKRQMVFLEDSLVQKPISDRVLLLKGSTGIWKLRLHQAEFEWTRDSKRGQDVVDFGWDYLRIRWKKNTSTILWITKHYDFIYVSSKQINFSRFSHKCSFQWNMTRIPLSRSLFRTPFFNMKTQKLWRIPWGALFAFDTSTPITGGGRIRLQLQRNLLF